MIEIIKGCLLNTPWWVYLLFYILVKRGIAASETRTVSIYKLALLPLILSAWSIWGIINFTSITPELFTAFMLFLLIGIYFGWRLVCGQPISVVDRKSRLLKIPGSWTTLVIILIVFFTKYCFDFEMAANPVWMHQAIPLYSLVIVSAVISGVLCGRLLNYFYRFKVPADN